MSLVLPFSHDGGGGGGKISLLTQGVTRKVAGGDMLAGIYTSGLITDNTADIDDQFPDTIALIYRLRFRLD